MMKRRQRSLSYKLLAGVFLSSSLITLIITFVQLYWDYRVELDRIHQNLLQVEDLYLPGVTQSLWDLNDDHVKLNLEGITQISDIAYAAIISDSKIQYQAGKLPSGNFRSLSFEIDYPREKQVYHLGTLHVVASLAGVYNRLQDKVLLVFISSFVKSLILSGLMLFLFYQVVTKHLVAIASYLKKIDFESLPPPLVLDRKKQSLDELDLVTESINRMTQKITEQFQLRHQAEEQLRELNASLEKEVKRRTKENEEQQIMIQNSARLSSLGEMAGSIAHEINNPLTIIAGYVAMLRKHFANGDLTPEKVDHIGGRIELTVERITAIIKGLLRLSRDDSQDLSSIHAINSIVNDAVAICNEKFLSNGIKFEVEIPSEAIYVKCRPIEIGQVVINLLNNAFDEVRHSPSAWIKLKMTQKTNMVEISVCDSGPGIPAEIRDKILEPFFTTKPQGQGTGLGLSISRAIAHKHGGKLYLDESSSITRFVIQLPASKGADTSFTSSYHPISVNSSVVLKEPIQKYHR